MWNINHWHPREFNFAAIWSIIYSRHPLRRAMALTTPKSYLAQTGNIKLGVTWESPEEVTSRGFLIILTILVFARKNKHVFLLMLCPLFKLWSIQLPFYCHKFTRASELQKVYQIKTSVHAKIHVHCFCFLYIRGHLWVDAMSNHQPVNFHGCSREHPAVFPHIWCKQKTHGFLQLPLGNFHITMEIALIEIDDFTLIWLICAIIYPFNMVFFIHFPYSHVKWPMA
jgi:hypothetical protein